MSSILLAFGFLLILEGIGPLISPKGWRTIADFLSRQEDKQLSRIGGYLVVSGCVICYMILWYG